MELKNREAMEAAVLAHINSMPIRGGKNTRNQAWNDELLDARNYLVYEMIVNGLSRAMCVKEIKSRFGVGTPTAEKYYTEALNSLIVDNGEIVDEARKVAIERLQDIYQDCKRRHIYGMALSAQDQLNKINGLYTDKKQIEVTGIKFDFGERE